MNPGTTVSFRIATDARLYHLEIYRLGYYGGDGARLVAVVRPSVATPQAQPPCRFDPNSGLFDCGNWNVSASWTVPPDAVSGVYIARLVRDSGGFGASHIVFVVRNDASHSALLFQTSDTTWQAYNTYGGFGSYIDTTLGGHQAYYMSYNRPFNTRSVFGGQSWLFNAEYPMIRFLEANGYDLSYTTGLDVDQNGAPLLNHKVFLSVGHDEYWSGQQRANVTAARDAGVNLAFFSGDEIFWKTRWVNVVPFTNVWLVTYKELLVGLSPSPGKLDPSPLWTGMWRDPRFSPPSDGGRPENALERHALHEREHRRGPGARRRGPRPVLAQHEHGDDGSGDGRLAARRDARLRVGRRRRHRRGRRGHRGVPRRGAVPPRRRDPALHDSAAAVIAGLEPEPGAVGREPGRGRVDRAQPTHRRGHPPRQPLPGTERRGRSSPRAPCSGRGGWTATTTTATRRPTRACSRRP